MEVTLDSRELATVLAALRRWQVVLDGPAQPREWDIATNEGTVEPLNETEIDALCERLNVEDGDV